jgi:DNA replication protein DnaC
MVDDRAARLVMVYAERARLRRAARPISLTKTGAAGLGEIGIERMLERSGVPERYRRGSWSQVRVDDVHDIAKTLAARLARRGPLSGHGAVFLGAPGTGKSMAAGLLCRLALRRGFTVRYSYLPTLMDELLASSWNRLKIVRRQASAQLLVWDDFLVRPMSALEVSFMDEIVEERYQRRKPMIVTGNVTVDDLDAQVFGDPDADHRYARMVDRWRQQTASTRVVFGGETRRSTRPRKMVTSTRRARR